MSSIESKVKEVCLDVKTRSIAVAKGIQEHYPAISLDCLSMEILSYCYALLNFGKIKSLPYDYLALVAEDGNAVTIAGNYFTDYIKEFGETIKTKESFLAFAQYFSNFKISDRLFQYRLRYILANNDCASIAWRGFNDLPNDSKAIAISQIILEALQDM